MADLGQASKPRISPVWPPLARQEGALAVRVSWEQYLRGEAMFREPAKSDHQGVGGAAARHDSASPGKRTLTSGLSSQPLVDGPTEVPATSTAAAPPRSGGPGLVGLFGRPGASATPISDREPDGPRSTEVAQATTEGPAPEQATTQGAPSGSETPRPGPHTPGAVSDAPTASYIVPFDRSPLAAPGERIICRAEFTGGTASEYEIVYTTTGGHFTTATGPTTCTIQGLTSGNVNFFVPTPWNGTDAVSITMQLKKKSDGSVVQTETWNFGKKAYYPTTMTQREGTGEVDLPGRYTYDIGPARPSGTAPFYEHQTILEWFDNWSISNIAPEDIREAYRTAHGLTSTAAITTHFIGAYAGNNGTFTVNANDRVGDRHGGNPDVENLASNLTAPKDIEVALPQTYEAQPGTALARFMVTRVRKTDGSWKVKKAPR
ncbi:MAG TPA: hypothetical protein VF516_10400 [Kofleriaceae bacterium]